MLNACRTFFRRKSPFSRTFSNTTYPTLPTETHIIEDTLRYYKPDQYYPVNIGNGYEARYQITGKPDYGAYSTSNQFNQCSDLFKKIIGTISTKS